MISNAYAGGTTNPIDGQVDGTGYGCEYTQQPTSQIPTDSFYENQGNFDMPEDVLSDLFPDDVYYNSFQALPIQALPIFQHKE